MKIAIVKLSALGDIVNAMIVLQFIKKYNPNIMIDWVVEKSYEELLSNNPSINEIHTVNFKLAKQKKSLLFFFKEISEETLLNKASSLAYNFMLAIFPAIIFLFTLIPYIPKSIGFQDQLMSLLALILPNNAYLAFEATINDIVNKPHGGLLSLGFLLSMYFAANGTHTLMMAFNKSSLIVESRSVIKTRITSACDEYRRKGNGRIGI